MSPNQFTILGALAAASALAGCQQTPATTASAEAPLVTTGASTTPTTPAGAPTEVAARAAIGRYLQGQLNANLYVVDSARATDLGAYWQVLVPRTDWAHRMPNRAAFEVDKQTGDVKTLLVK